MIKAQILECYKVSQYQGKTRLETVVHETRYFTTRTDAKEWVNALALQELHDPYPVQTGVYVKIDKLGNHKSSQFMHGSMQNRPGVY